MLKSLTFDINSNPETSPDAAEMLGSVIERKINLQSVQIDLSFTGLDESGCYKLVSGISGHPRLLSLEMVMNGCSVSVDMKQRVQRLCQEMSARRRPDKDKEDYDVARQGPRRSSFA